MRPAGDNLGHAVRAAHNRDINVIVEARSSRRFEFIREPEGWFVLVVRWHSNAVFLFSRVPLFLRLTTKRRSAVG